MTFLFISDVTRRHVHSVHDVIFSLSRHENEEILCILIVLNPTNWCFLIDRKMLKKRDEFRERGQSWTTVRSQV